jgi:hypothetical protein
MPHVVYLAASLLCPWPGCGYRIELIDFQLEKLNDASLYARVMTSWGVQADFGLVARCPGCQGFVLFGSTSKQRVDDPAATGLPVLPDDWHQTAYIG